jgi:hypothetical protein
MLEPRLPLSLTFVVPAISSESLYPTRGLPILKVELCGQEQSTRQAGARTLVEVLVPQTSNPSLADVVLLTDMTILRLC